MAPVFRSGRFGVVVPHGLEVFQAHRAGGFTLAELLIALAILGVIATFTIPKILQNQQASRQKAVTREAIASVYQVLHQGIYDGSLNENTTTTQYRTYFTGALNHVSQCSDAVTEGCWIVGQFVHTGAPGLKLHNGSLLVVANSAAGTGPGERGGYMGFDWNGAEPPNQAGVDQMVVCVSFGSNTFVNGASSWGIIPVGALHACENAPTSVTLFNETFSN